MLMRFAAIAFFGMALAFLGAHGVAQASDIDGTYSVSGTNPNGTTYSGQVSIQQQGSSYYMRWRIANGQILEGRGTRRGNVLTINWGQKYPVIYTVGSDGTLRGTWSNGKATENLFPLTPRPSPRQETSALDGTYDVSGTNPNGTTYSGEVTIELQGSSYYMRWRIANGQTLEGRGTLRGNVLTINWGQQYPVIYTVESNGVLRGTWSNGAATEDLFPRNVKPPEVNSSLNGVYDVRGQNSSGTRYTGEVTIQLQGSSYLLSWRIGSGQTFEGRGTLRDGVLTVNWGQKYPVIYNVQSDGSLRGTWNGGSATEDLLPKVISARQEPTQPSTEDTVEDPNKTARSWKEPDVATTGKEF